MTLTAFFKREVKSNDVRNKSEIIMLSNGHQIAFQEIRNYKTNFNFGSDLRNCEVMLGDQNCWKNYTVQWKVHFYSVTVIITLTFDYRSFTISWPSHYLTVLNKGTLRDARYQAFLSGLIAILLSQTCSESHLTWLFSKQSHDFDFF